MEARKIADWLQVLGNLGIVLGLFFVGLQLYQDRQLKTAELVAGYFDTRIMANIGVMGDEPHRSIVKAATDPDAMTPEDAYIYFANLDSWMSLWMRYARLAEFGLVRDDWVEWSGMPLEAGTPMGIREVRSFVAANADVFPEAFRVKLKADLEDPARASAFQRKLDYLLETRSRLED